MRTPFHLVLSLAATLALSACGGGSESAADNATTATDYQTGMFLDSAVEGVGYRTESGSGLTGMNGEFRYRTGESVTFTIGNTILGTAIASPVVTPLDFAPDGTSETDPRIANVLVLLQSLDDDAKPGNGIRITSAARTSFTEANPISPGQAPLGFVGDSSLTDLLATATRQNASPRSGFVSVDSALRHFSSTTTQHWYQGEWELSWGDRIEKVVVNSLGVLVLPRSDSSAPEGNWVAGIAGYVTPAGAVVGQLAFAGTESLYQLDLNLQRDGSASGKLTAQDGREVSVLGRRTASELSIPSTLAQYVGVHELEFEGAADVTEECAWNAKCVSGKFSLRIEPDGSASAKPSFDQSEGKPSLDLSYVGHLASDGTVSLYLEPPERDPRCTPVLLNPFAGMFSYSFVPSQMILDGHVSPGGWGANGVDVKGKVAADDEYCKRFSRPNALGPILTMPPART